MTVWEEFQGSGPVRGRWLPPLLLSLVLHLCLLRLLVPAQEALPPQVSGRQAMTVILASPLPALPAPAPRQAEAQAWPATVPPAAVAEPFAPVRSQEQVVSPSLRLLPVQIKKTIQPEAARAGQLFEAAPLPAVAAESGGEETAGGRAESTAAAGGAEVPSAPVAVQAAVPLAADNRPPEYPALARKRGWQGKVLLAVAVASDGTAQAVRVQNGSGFELLDEAALEAVRRWRFQPGSRGGEPVATQVQVPVHFLLADNR